MLKQPWILGDGKWVDIMKRKYEYFWILCECYNKTGLNYTLKKLDEFGTSLGKKLQNFVTILLSATIIVEGTYITRVWDSAISKWN